MGRIGRMRVDVAPRPPHTNALHPPSLARAQWSRWWSASSTPQTARRPRRPWRTWWARSRPSRWPLAARARGCSPELTGGPARPPPSRHCCPPTPPPCSFACLPRWPHAAQRHARASASAVAPPSARLFTTQPPLLLDRVSPQPPPSPLSRHASSCPPSAPALACSGCALQLAACEARRAHWVSQGCKCADSAAARRATLPHSEAASSFMSL